MRQPLIRCLTPLVARRLAVSWGLLAAAGLPISAAIGEDAVIHAGAAVTRPGEPVLENVSIVIEDGLIVEIAEGFAPPTDARTPVYDLRTAVVTPGLIDTHVHLTNDPRPGFELDGVLLTSADLALRAARNAEALLAAGFTTVMDMGTGARAHEVAIYAVRDAIARGETPGPQILAAGSPISATGASRHPRLPDALEAVAGPQGVCDGPEACRRAVREQIARGADFINFYNTGSLLAANSPAKTFTDAELGAIVETAHGLGRIAVADGGNTPGDASGVDAAIRAGADIIDTVTFPGPGTFELAREAGVYVAPHVYALDAAVGDSLDSLDQGSMGWLPRRILERLFDLKQNDQTLARAYAAGASLAFAADSGVFPHGDNARELIAYVARGVPAEVALAAATVNAAAAHGIAGRTGAIAPGLEADLAAFADNPLETIETTLSPLFVMADGRVYAAPPTGRSADAAEGAESR